MLIRSAILGAGLLVVVLGLLVTANAADIAGPARVIDGDTLQVGGTRIRLHGIDAPERSEPGGREATRGLIEIVRGRRVSCRDTGARTYRRIVARCTIGRGKDIAAMMVGSGLAAACPRFTAAYVELEKRARKRGDGIWSRRDHAKKRWCG